MFERCHNEGQGAPGCLGIADSRFIMRFDDIGEEPIHWCSVCGADAQKINLALQKAFQERPRFAEQLKAAIEDAKKS